MSSLLDDMKEFALKHDLDSVEVKENSIPQKITTYTRDLGWAYRFYGQPAFRSKVLRHDN